MTATATATETATATDGPVGTSRRHTSEPRWPLERPGLDPATRHVVIVTAADATSQASARAWAAEAAALGATRELVAAPDATRMARGLEAALASAGPASRVVVAGDESAIARTLAAALAAGYVATEVRAHLTHPEGLRPVQCVHCKGITDTTAAVDELVDCAACGRPLLIFPHFSRRIGAYLGFRHDAEELPA